MVSIEEIQAAYYMVAATGVLVAAGYYVLNLQMTRRKQKLDNTIYYGNLFTDKEWVKQWHQVLFEQHFTTYEEWAKKYRTDPEAFSNLYAIQGLMSMIGMCVEEDVVDRELLFKRGFNVWVKILYPKLLPWINGMRTRYNDPKWNYYPEYLYNEVLRMYPDIVVPEDMSALFYSSQ
jgi:hypothetical protein